METDYIIRVEEPKDYAVVENLTRDAFWNVYRPGCNEHYILHCYRNNPDFISELSLVMEKNGKIIGHVMYSKAALTFDNGRKIPAWTFGPISIHPDYRRKGYGLELLKYSLEKARKMGIGFVCIEGNIDFYRHLGFCIASKFNIHYHGEPKEADVPYFLALEIIPGYFKKNGVSGATYHSPKGYCVAAENQTDFAEYESSFPYKEKLVLPGQL